MTYQNVETSRNTAVFINVNGDANEATFKSKQIAPNVGSYSVPMVKSSVSLRIPVDHTPCNSECTIEVFESIKLEFSILRDTDPSAAKTELLRLVDKAIADYSLTNGFVPPVAATFEV